MVKANCGDEELALPASAVKEERTIERRRLEMQLALNNRRRFLNLVCLLSLLIPKGIPRSLFHFVLVVGFFKVTYFLKNITRSAPPNFLLSNPWHSHRFQLRTEQRIQKWLMYIKQVYFVLSKQKQQFFSRSSRHFVPKDQTNCVYMQK